VRLDGLLADMEIERDHLVRVATDHASDYVQLPLRQSRDTPHRVCSANGNCLRRFDDVDDCLVALLGAALNRVVDEL
jgi:hypothetical protein